MYKIKPRIVSSLAGTPGSKRVMREEELPPERQYYSMLTKNYTFVEHSVSVFRCRTAPPWQFYIFVLSAYCPPWPLVNGDSFARKVQSRFLVSWQGDRFLSVPRWFGLQSQSAASTHFSIKVDCEVILCILFSSYKQFSK